MKETIARKASLVDSAQQPGPAQRAALPARTNASLLDIGTQLQNSYRLGHDLAQTQITANDLRPHDGGQPLPEPLKSRMEHVLGSDLADVRIHHDSRADALQAEAYTLGNHILFATDRYQPQSESGRSLLGHELAHVVQQRSGQAVAEPGQKLLSKNEPALEAQAEAMGTMATNLATTPAPSPALGNHPATGPGAQGSGPVVQLKRAKASRNPDRTKNIVLADMVNNGPSNSEDRRTAGMISEMQAGWSQSWGAALSGAARGARDWLGGGVESDLAFRRRMAAGLAEVRQKMAESETRDDPNVPQDFVDPSLSAHKLELRRLEDRRLVSRGATPETTRIGKEPKLKKGQSLSKAEKAKLDARLRVKTLSRPGADSLEYKLNKPLSTAAHVRSGMVERQKQVMRAAADAQSIIARLEQGSDLSATHYRQQDVLDNQQEFKGGFQWDPNRAAGQPKQAVKGPGPNFSPVSVVGMDEFANEPNPPNEPPNPNKVQRLLPVLRPGPARGQEDALKSTVGRWGEADIHQLGTKRDAERILHTAPQSIEESTGRPIDSPIYLSVDHYESAVPITSVKTNYKNTTGYTRQPAYQPAPGDRNTLDTHRRLEAERARNAARQARILRKQNRGK